MACNEHTPAGEPDSWTWPDAYGDYPDFGDDCAEFAEECPHCDGTGWQRLDDAVAMECPECGGDGFV